MTGGPLGPLLLLLVVGASDAWVFLDARKRQERDDDVVADVGPVTLATPQHWLLGCILLWIVVLPLYLVARRA